MRASFFSNILFSLFFVISNTSFLSGLGSDVHLNEAQATYQQAVEASTFWVREEKFNKALSLFQSLSGYDPQSTYLNEVLGDLYLQLNEYPWAILHYERALWYGGSGDSVISNLREAKEKLGISKLKLDEEKKRGGLFLLSSHQTFLFGGFLLTFFSLSCAIWFPFPAVRKVAFVFLLAFLALVGNTLFYYYFSPVEGVVIQSTGIYREPSKDDVQLIKQCLQAGSKVEILKISPDGQWLKVRGQTIGYIPIEKLQPISIEK